ncbi:MAG: phosphoribosylamine--glycine ligase [Omnitrophica WOR_2 bacterium GWA2_47_8]|nr:MAG: phosphoribosylamine--glycine ligase [Omnitrophica WOR_2 bacterium GWA2_47_8]
MKILLVGSGGREHVLAWKMKQSAKVKELYCAPGNGGISDVAECVDIQATDIPALLKFAKEKKIDLTVVGPEAPLTAGIVDEFEKHSLKIFGPSRAAAQLEGSKAFAKDFMHRFNIPTAVYKTFDDIKKAKEFLHNVPFPIVIKADGLAGGKGVFICQKFEEGIEALEQIMQQKVFKDSGNKVVIEECLIGEEASILVVSDGKDYVILESSQDHKRIFDDDQGPNTGGMGAYSPTPFITKDILGKIDARIVEPTIRGMHKEGHPFKGVLYVGLMITIDGPVVLEYNVRFGDPEAQAVLPRLKSDLVEILLASCERRLNTIRLIWDKRSCVSVVMCAGGYPGQFETGKEITGLEASNDKDIFVFHAGTKRQNSKFLTNGGRVLSVASLGDGIADAIEKVYKAVDKIKFYRCFFRRDIAAKAIRKATRRTVPMR